MAQIDDYGFDGEGSYEGNNQQETVGSPDEAEAPPRRVFEEAPESYQQNNDQEDNYQPDINPDDSESSEPQGYQDRYSDNNQEDTEANTSPKPYPNDAEASFEEREPYEEDSHSQDY